jgi:hypothetical protein
MFNGNSSAQNFMSTERVGDNRVVGVFICSTFRDMQAERDHLVTVVFPELRERLKLLGLQLADIDLRWGVPESDVDTERTNSWTYCKRCIDHSHPFFIALLGQRYGYVPRDDEIEDPRDRTRFAGLSITEMELQYALETQASRRVFFYLRPPCWAEPLSTEFRARFEEAPTVEQERLVGAEAATARAKDRARRIKNLREAVEKSGQPVRKYSCSWSGDRITDLDSFGDLVLEDIWSGLLREEVFVDRQAWIDAGFDPSDEIYTDVTRPLTRDQWIRIVNAAKGQDEDPLESEARQMIAFARTRAAWFHGRERELETVERFLGSEARHGDHGGLCLVTGTAGQGKSAFIAELFNRVCSQPMVFIHFVGATPESADLMATISRLLAELDRLGVRLDNEDSGLDIDTLKRRLADRLAQYDGEHRLLILVDALNQIDAAGVLDWLPAVLGPSVRIVVSSTLPDEFTESGRERAILSRLEARSVDPLRVTLEPLGDSDVRAIARAYLSHYGKKLAAKDEGALCGLPASHHPLYLRVLLEELRMMSGEDLHHKVGSAIEFMRQERPNVESLFRGIIERLSGAFGASVTHTWFSHLAASRAGMSSAELSKLAALNTI